jgi:hypothetical protein
MKLGLDRALDEIYDFDICNWFGDLAVDLFDGS